MSSWFSRMRAPKPVTLESDRLELPEGMWTKCDSCSAILYSKELERDAYVCPKCAHHFLLSAARRIELLTDTQTFEELDAGLRTKDPIAFKGYKEKLKKAERDTGSVEAVRTGRARIEGRPVMLGVFEYKFIGGSMGTIVGEKLLRMIELAMQENRPVIIVSASGGARMHEGIFSLMQMARITCGLARLAKQRLPYISLLTHPTTGGVAASFAMLGDVIIAEPGALIGFAGPRVIEQTIRKTLPEGFQRSEFLLEHGMIDMIVGRAELKSSLANLLELLSYANDKKVA